jgi:hypothetical protein
MPSAQQRYATYISHVEASTHRFFETLDGQLEDQVRDTLEKKGYGKQAYLARIWLSFRDQMQLEIDEEEGRKRLNRAILLNEHQTPAQPATRDGVRTAASTGPGFFTLIRRLLTRGDG